MLNGNTFVATSLLRQRQKLNEMKAASVFHFNCIVTSRWLKVQSDMYTFYIRRRSLVYVSRKYLCCAWDEIPQHPAHAVSTSSFRTAILSAFSFSMLISLCSSHPPSSTGQSGVTLFMNCHEISHGSAVSRRGIIPMSSPLWHRKRSQIFLKHMGFERGTPKETGRVLFQSMWVGRHSVYPNIWAQAVDISHISYLCWYIMSPLTVSMVHQYVRLSIW